jgi:5-methylcytosine-specific restriction endonuclease McrA
MKRAKRRFSYAERYAVWHGNRRKCWWCKEPLWLVEVTVDHVLPESLLNDAASREVALTEYGLSKQFNINGYENWLPCHNHCNQSKSSRLPTFVPGTKRY